MKKDILNLPLWEISSTLSPTAFTTKYTLAKNHTWFLPQAVAFFGNLTAVKNETGLYCAKLTLDKGLEDVHGYAIGEPDSPWDTFATEGQKKKWFIGLYRVLTSVARTDLVDVKSFELPRYSQLVPLILSGFKQNQGIKYSQWDKSTLDKVVDFNLLDAMLYSEKIDMPSGKDFYDLVSQLCTRAGKVQPFDTCAMLSHFRGTVLEDAPRLVRTMATQTWLAHPRVRDTEYMILNWLDWDTAPAPTLTSESLATNLSSNKSKPVKKLKASTSDLEIPWD